MLESALLNFITAPSAVALVCGLVAFLWLYWTWQPAWIAQLPTIRAQGLFNAHDAAAEGYEKYTKHGKVWLLRHPSQDIVMLPLEWIDEIKGRPLKEASALDAIENRTLGRYSTIGHHQPLFLHVLRSKLVPMSNSAAVMRVLLDECQNAVHSDIGDCMDWKSFPVHSFCNIIISRMVGRMAGGTELGHDSTWLQLATKQVQNCASVALTLVQWPWYCRPFLYPFIKSTRDMKAGQRRMQKLVEPLVEKRKRSPKMDPDILQMLVDAQPQPNMTELADSMTDLAIFSILTTTRTITDVLLYLAAHPEYQTILREETQHIMGKRLFAELNYADLVRMTKFDSFVNETLRLSTSSFGLSRKIKVDGLTLPNGNRLPRGCYVATPAEAIVKDSSYWPKADDFDPLRFYRLRQEPGEENRHQVVTLDRTSFAFGAGPGACPGRFLVINEVKILGTFILLNYDLKINLDSKGSFDQFRNRVDRIYLQSRRASS